MMTFIYRILIENIPFTALYDKNRKFAYPRDINPSGVKLDLYHTPPRTSSDVISHPFPLIIRWHKLIQQNQAQYQHNIKLLEKIVDAIILCGKQNIPLRGHRDDTTSDSSNKGNSLAILQLLAKHDEQLWSHLQNAKIKDLIYQHNHSEWGYPTHWKSHHR